MTQGQIEGRAEQVRAAHGLTRLPVDPMAVAVGEGIGLAPGCYDGCFDGRIEHRADAGGGRFYLFYAEEDPPQRRASRVRFSVAHELGHFFLSSHRDYLVSGTWRGCSAKFLSVRRLEWEADYFARALLMPRRRFVAYARRKGGGPCTLGELAHLARRVFHTPLMSTAVRYTQLDLWPCGVVLSEGGSVLFSLRSRAMKDGGCGWIDRIPPASVTARLLAARGRGKKPMAQGLVGAEIWFGSRPCRLREEARILGRGGRVLTYLLLDEGGNRG